MEWYLPAIDGGISNFPTSDGGICNLPASNPYLYATIPGWPGTRNEIVKLITVGIQNYIYSFHSVFPHASSKWTRNSWVKINKEKKS